MRLASAIAFLVMVLHAPSLVAQSSAPAAGTVINGQVTVHLTITLRESANDYGPIADHPLILYRSTGDSLQIRTDDTGVLRFLIAPGSYRLVSAAPAQWRGRGYRWNVPLEVRPGMGVVDLTNATASVSGVEFIDRQRRGPVASEKHASTAVLLSVLIAGAGQMYAGRPGKGAALMAVSLFTTVVGVAAAGASQSAALDDRSNPGADAAAIAGIGIGLGTWVYSMVTAPRDVRDYNVRQLNRVSALPVLKRRNGRTAAGLALRF